MIFKDAAAATLSFTYSSKSFNALSRSGPDMKSDLSQVVAMALASTRTSSFRASKRLYYMPKMNASIKESRLSIAPDITATGDSFSLLFNGGIVRPSQ